MKFGASIWPFQWDPPYEDGISRIASLGFEAMELIGQNREILHEYYTPKKVKELRRFVEDSGLEISEFVSTPIGMASPDDKELHFPAKNPPQFRGCKHTSLTFLVNVYSEVSR